jgi:hypothetical protein
MTSDVQDGLRFTAVGLAIGPALSVAVGQTLRGVLYGITPTDLATYVVSSRCRWWRHCSRAMSQRDARR